MSALNRVQKYMKAPARDALPDGPPRDEPLPVTPAPHEPRTPDERGAFASPVHALEAQAHAAFAAETEAPSSRNEREHRRRVLLRGRARYAAGAISIDVLVRDLTLEGARLSALQDLNIPATFELTLENRRVADCEVVWRRDGQIGVRFLYPLAALPTTGQAIVEPGANKPSLRRKRS